MTYTISEKGRKNLQKLLRETSQQPEIIDDLVLRPPKEYTEQKLHRLIDIILHDENSTTTPSNDHKTGDGKETDFLNKNGTKVDWGTSDYMFTTTPNFIIWNKKEDKQYTPNYRGYVHELLINPQGALKLNNGEGYSGSDEDGEPLHLRYEVRWNPTPYTEIADRKPHITLELPENRELGHVLCDFYEWCGGKRILMLATGEVLAMYDEWLKTLKK